MGKAKISVKGKLEVVDHVWKNGNICKGSRTLFPIVIKIHPSQILKSLKEEEGLKGTAKIHRHAFLVHTDLKMKKYNLEN